MYPEYVRRVTSADYALIPAIIEVDVINWWYYYSTAAVMGTQANSRPFLSLSLSLLFAAGRLKVPARLQLGDGCYSRAGS